MKRKVKQTSPNSVCFGLDSNITMLILPGKKSQHGFFPKGCNQKGTWRHTQIHVHMHIHIQIHVPHMGPGPAARLSARPDPAARAGAHVRYTYLYMYMHMYMYYA